MVLKKKKKRISCIKLSIPAAMVTTTVKQSTMSHLFTCRVYGIPIFIFIPWGGCPMLPFHVLSGVLEYFLLLQNLAFHLGLYNEATWSWQNLAKLDGFCWREYRNYNEVRAGMYKALCQDVFTAFLQTMLGFARDGSVSSSTSVMPK